MNLNPLSEDEHGLLFLCITATRVNDHKAARVQKVLCGLHSKKERKSFNLFKSF